MFTRGHTLVRGAHGVPFEHLRAQPRGRLLPNFWRKLFGLVLAAVGQRDVVLRSEPSDELAAQDHSLADQVGDVVLVPAGHADVQSGRLEPSHRRGAPFPVVAVRVNFFVVIHEALAVVDVVHPDVSLRRAHVHRAAF